MIIRQRKEENYKPVLYIGPVNNDTGFEKILKKNFTRISSKFNDVELCKSFKEWSVKLPVNFQEENEAHFARLPINFSRYLKNKNMPVWEVPNMLAKYYITTKALEKALTHNKYNLLMKKIIVTLLVLNMFAVKAQQYPRVDIPGSEIRKITSTIIAGQQYELQVLLPAGYATSTKKYPVVYLMDSQWDFPDVKSIYGQQYFDGFIPELIVVGVTWGGANPNPDSLRARDYTPTNEARLPQSGGADQFLDFMKKELFPFVENNYKADSDNRTLMGCSLGGLFTLYTLFTHTDMFTGYAAASPAVGWDKEVLYKYEKTFAEKKLTKKLRVYMTVGDVERGRPVFEKFANNMHSRNYSNVSLRSKVLENTGHSGTKSETYSRGLQYVFERNQLKLSDDEFKKYVGIYSTGGGNKIEIRNEGNQLTWYYAPENKFTLFANTEKHFYATHEFFNVYFKVTNGKIEGFDLVRYGSTQAFNKIN